MIKLFINFGCVASRVVMQVEKLALPLLLLCLHVSLMKKCEQKIINHGQDNYTCFAQKINMHVTLENSKKKKHQRCASRASIRDERVRIVYLTINYEKQFYFNDKNLYIFYIILCVSQRVRPNLRMVRGGVEVSKKPKNRLNQKK